jgi:hypothetical protein
MTLELQASAYFPYLEKLEQIIQKSICKLRGEHRRPDNNSAAVVEQKAVKVL